MKKTEKTKKNTTLKQASQLIQSVRQPLLICHVAPDGDAIGSMMGLGRALRQMGLEPVLACSDPIPARFNYIPGTEVIVQDVGDPFDLVISIDCSDLERLGSLTQMQAFENAPLLNIDHHLTNLNFGDVNLVDPHASSTAEVVLRLLEYMAVPLDAELAICLLTGIVTDTRGFRTSNVTAQVMQAALRLMQAGASLPYITRFGLDRRSTAAILLWREALSSVQINGRVIWTSITLAMRHEVDQMGNGDAGLVSFLISAEDADIAAVFVERTDGRIEVGLRAVPGFDVAQVALQFGGGGHALAAGCNIPGPLEEAQAQVLFALQSIVHIA
ncbi:MAG: bifunctional oligoribonuclease/PAP phosphatase NrnA [Chloroflexota bacterium]|nr:bifunctional oligoribonuclease/PAP phosphatase NrnA [Chloroflexota bacterium]